MKTNYIVLLLIIFMIIITLLYILIIRKKEDESVKEIEIKEVNSFYLTYSKGYAINSNIRYEMDIDKYSNNCIVKIKPYEVAEEDKKELVVDNIKMRELETILKKHHVGKWNGFNKNDPNVLDGDDFSLSIMMNNGDKIHASGYMMWPDGYREFIQDIDNFFMNLYNGKDD